MLGDVLVGLATLLLMCATFAIHPRHAQAPAGWYVNGIRPDGEFGIRPIPARHASEELPPRFHPVEGDPSEDVEIRSRIYCTGGSVPIVLDGEAVGCQRWSP